MPLRLHVNPGDLITAYVAVHGHHALFRLTDLTRRRRLVIHRVAPYVDVSSAEWIVEAPLNCSAPHRCYSTRLANFGSFSFRAAKATLGRRSYSIASRRWTSSSIELEQNPIREASGMIVISANPDRRPSRRGGFAVYWHSRPAPAEAMLQ